MTLNSSLNKKISFAHVQALNQTVTANNYKEITVKHNKTCTDLGIIGFSTWGNPLVYPVSVNGNDTYCYMTLMNPSANDLIINVQWNFIYW